MNLDKTKILEGIKTTGFGLEFRVAQLLSKRGWTVISNKYYIDDVQGTSREIDLLAYKVAKKNGTFVYTVLVVSCKKATDKCWVLLSKNKNNNDPNTDWSPVSFWSNNKYIKYSLREEDWKQKYINDAEHVLKGIFIPEKHIFAFQEMSSVNGKPQNDKAIYNSIVSSMKSQYYEIESLEKRKREKTIYNFNLISVVDAPMLRADYTDSDTTLDEINSEIYVGNYIVGKKETCSRVHIVNASVFGDHIETYDKLHNYNVNKSEEFEELYFYDCLKNTKKIQYQIDVFSKRVAWKVGYALNKNSIDVAEWEKIKLDIIWYNNTGKPTISVEDIWTDEPIAVLNADAELNKEVAKALLELFRYDGDFEFGMDIPF